MSDEVTNVWDRVLACEHLPILVGINAYDHFYGIYPIGYYLIQQFGDRAALEDHKPWAPMWFAMVKIAEASDRFMKYGEDGECLKN